MRYSNRLIKKCYRIGSYHRQISFVELYKTKDWISLSSGHHNLVSKDTLYREQVGRVWKWVILICVGSNPFLTCLWELFSIHWRLSTISSPIYNLIIYPPAFLPLFSKLRESTQGMAVLTRREVDNGVRATSRFLSKFDFFPFFRSWLKRSKEGSNPPPPHSKDFKIN